MYSSTSAVLYLESLVEKSSASRTFKSTGIGPPLDSSPPGGSAPFAGLHDNMILLYSLQTCQTATNKGPTAPWFCSLFKYRDGTKPEHRVQKKSVALVQTGRLTGVGTTDMFIIKAGPDRYNLQPNQEIKTLINNSKYASTQTVRAAMVKVRVSSKP